MGVRASAIDLLNALDDAIQERYERHQVEQPAELEKKFPSGFGAFRHAEIAAILYTVTTASRQRTVDAIKAAGYWSSDMARMEEP